MKIKFLWFWSILATLTVFALGYFLQVQQDEIPNLRVNRIIEEMHSGSVVAFPDTIFESMRFDSTGLIVVKLKYLRGVHFDNFSIGRDNDFGQMSDSLWRSGLKLNSLPNDTLKIKNVKTYPLNPGGPDSAKIIVWQYIGTLGAGESVVDTLQF